jgi:hypothetical protein
MTETLSSIAMIQRALGGDPPYKLNIAEFRALTGEERSKFAEECAAYLRSQGADVALKQD